MNDEHEMDRWLKNMFYDCVMLALDEYPFKRKGANHTTPVDPHSRFCPQAPFRELTNTNSMTEDRMDLNMQILNNQMRSMSTGRMSSGHIVNVAANWYPHYRAFTEARSYDERMRAALGWAVQYPSEHVAFLHLLYEYLHGGKAHFLPSLRRFNRNFEEYGSTAPDYMYNPEIGESRYLVDDVENKTQEYLHFLNAVWVPSIGKYAPSVREAMHDFLAAYYTKGNPEYMVEHDPVYMQMGLAMHLMPTSYFDSRTGDQKFDWKLTLKDVLPNTYP